jgi:hypothetical protein
MRTRAAREGGAGRGGPVGDGWWEAAGAGGFARRRAGAGRPRGRAAGRGHSPDRCIAPGAWRAAARSRVTQSRLHCDVAKAPAPPARRRGARSAVLGRARARQSGAGGPGAAAPRARGVGGGGEGGRQLGSTPWEGARTHRAGLHHGLHHARWRRRGRAHGRAGVRGPSPDRCRIHGHSQTLHTPAHTVARSLASPPRANANRPRVAAVAT